MRFGEAWRPNCPRVLLYLARKVLPSLSWRRRTGRRTTWRSGAGPALGRIKRQEQRGVVRSPGLAPCAITLDASRYLDPPGISIRKNVEVRSRGVSGSCAAPRDDGVTAAGMVRQSNVGQSNVR